MKEISLEYRNEISPYLMQNGELSCENSFVNLLLWQSTYKNQYKIINDCFILYSTSPNGSLYRLPFCNDFKLGFEIITELNGGALPVFWAQDGERFEKFKALYSDKYDVCEKRDAFDYLYETEALSELKGKKYHSKRNHISAFSKKYDYIYEPITDDNTSEVLHCADLWYEGNADKFDKYMAVEKEGIKTLLKNREVLKVKGGLIRVNGEVVAFTLGSPINENIFDIHIEKALPQFAEAYTVINREFAKNELANFKYINREDDMGIEGLRRAKLSYKPYMLVKKYLCRPKNG